MRFNRFIGIPLMDGTHSNDACGPFATFEWNAFIAFIPFGPNEIGDKAQCHHGSLNYGRHRILDVDMLLPAPKHQIQMDSRRKFNWKFAALEKCMHETR